MISGPFLTEPDAGASRYTHLFACISEEDAGYTVQVRLTSDVRRNNVAWGEETMESFEAASALVAALAAEFSIAQTCVRIDIRMNKTTDGTRH
jgi:hypothetical protein